jgi:hypothetical protein
MEEDQAEEKSRFGPSATQTRAVVVPGKTGWKWLEVVSRSAARPSRLRVPPG